MEGATDTIQPLVQAWSDGDVAKLGSLMDANFADHPEAKKRLLTDRNQQWASQIERMLTDKRSYFITVGRGASGRRRWRAGAPAQGRLSGRWAVIRRE